MFIDRPGQAQSAVVGGPGPGAGGHLQLALHNTTWMRTAQISISPHYLWRRELSEDVTCRLCPPPVPLLSRLEGEAGAPVKLALVSTSKY